MNCHVCGKSFTGIANFQQHEQSEKHKKKVRDLDIRNSAADSNTIPACLSTQNQVFYCQVCNISFIGVEKFQMHSLSLEHIGMVMKLHEKNVADTSNFKPKQETASISDCKNSLDCKTSEDQFNDLLQPKYQYASATLSCYSECKVCKKIFTGPEPHRQHLESAMHKKKIASLNNVASDSTDNNNTMFNVLKCEICNKRFSGPFPYDQHLKSDVHKKKVKNEQLRGRYGKNDSFTVRAEADSNSEAAKEIKDDNVDQTQYDAVSGPRPWYVNICKTQHSGSIPYKMHFDGDIRHENKFKTEISQSKIKDSEEKHHSSVKVDDCIIHSLNDLEVLTADDLNLVYFEPDEKIEFKCGERKNDEKIEFKCGERKNDEKIEFKSGERKNDSKKEVSQEIKQDLNQKQNNIEVYQICDVCEVYLWNKEECIIHYDSKEHLMKKWSLKLF